MQAPCCVCSVDTGKYRCPGCRARYCSLLCCKKHKEECTPKEAPETTDAAAQPASSSYQQFERKDDLLEDDESDTVPLQKLKLLEESEDLKQLLQNTHLRQVLLALERAEKKEEVLKEYMQEPLFAEFADKCLSVVDNEEKENIFPD
ncbi:zinc finger HIT domain-containing protein 3 isoform X4 [Pseudophryne corroboree]|uniref:zinc finger HIT domain-containing protein 3 isoform X4 n=1 Tax=Pseudophryne corroboree TaxID=495146 RepID=UPI0030815E91